MPESPVLLHVWTVDPDRYGELVDSLSDLFGRMQSDPAFVSARILETEAHDSVAALVETSVPAADRRRLEALPDVRETLDQVQGAFSLVVKLYHEAEPYTED